MDFPKKVLRNFPAEVAENSTFRELHRKQQDGNFGKTFLGGVLFTSQLEIFDASQGE
jgi:hypothetical protein